MARSMVSFGMFSARALSTAVRKRGLPLGSPPPERAETVSSLMSLVQTFDFLESEASFLCLILLHRLWPDMAPIIVTAPPPASNFFARRRLDRPGRTGRPEPGSHRKSQAKFRLQHGQERLRRADRTHLRPTVPPTNLELVVDQRQPAAVGQRAGHDEAVFEVRVGVGAGEPVGHFPVDGWHLVVRELVDIAPGGPEA